MRGGQGQRTRKRLLSRGVKNLKKRVSRGRAGRKRERWEAFQGGRAGPESRCHGVNGGATMTFEDNCGS